MRNLPAHSFTAHPLLVALTGLCIAGAARGAAADDQGPRPATARAYQHSLERFDTNHDGLVQTAGVAPEDPP